MLWRIARLHLNIAGRKQFDAAFGKHDVLIGRAVQEAAEIQAV